MELVKKLETIVARLHQVQDHLAQMEEQLAALQLENDALQSTLHERERSLQELQDKLERAPQRGAEAREGVQPEEDTDIRQQILHYLSEIDQCIEWLSKQ
jgi:SOS response regulatory protein OraA/RecX